MSCPDSGSPGCLCLSDRLQTVFGAFAAVSVLYLLKIRIADNLDYRNFTKGRYSPEDMLADMHQLWSSHAALLNPVLKIAGTQAPSEECLASVLSALLPDKFARLPGECLKDKASVPAGMSQSAACKPLALEASFTNGISVCRSRKQAKSREKNDLQFMLSHLDCRGKVLLCPAFKLQPKDLSAITRARCDYICNLPFDDADFYADDEVTPEDISYYLRTYLEGDRQKELCLNADKHISGFFRTIPGKDGGAAVTESMQQCELLNFADYYAEVCAEEQLQADTDPEVSDEEKKLNAMGYQDDLLYTLQVWHDKGCAQSLLYLSRGKQASAFATSLPCLHDKAYLQRLQSLLQNRPAPADDRQMITLTDLFPAGVMLQKNRLNLQDNLKMADAQAGIVIQQIPDMLHQIQMPELSYEKLQALLSNSDKDEAVQTVLHLLQAHYRSNCNFLSNDKLLQRNKSLPAANQP